MNHTASDLFPVGAGAGRVVGSEEDEAVQEQRHLRVWGGGDKKSFKGKRQVRITTEASEEKPEDSKNKKPVKAPLSEDETWSHWDNHSRHWWTWSP